MDFKEIAKTLNDAFEASGLSYGDLSERTGLAKSALHRYLSGDTKKIPIDRMNDLCNAIGLDAKKVLGWEKKSETDVLTHRYETPEIEMMVTFMSSLSPDDQKRLLDICRLAFHDAFNSCPQWEPNGGPMGAQINNKKINKESESKNDFKSSTKGNDRL